MTNTHEQLVVAWATYIKENQKLNNAGVKNSAVLARKSLTEIKKLLVIRRREIQEQKDKL